MFSNTFKLSDSTFAILLIPVSLAILQWHINNVKDFRIVYIYSTICIILILTVFFSINYVKNTLFTAKKDKYNRIAILLKEVEKKLKNQQEDLCKKPLNHMKAKP